MDAEDVARITTRFDRDLVANSERYRTIQDELDLPDPQRSAGSLGKLAQVAGLFLLVGAALFGATILWAIAVRL